MVNAPAPPQPGRAARRPRSLAAVAAAAALALTLAACGGSDDEGSNGSGTATNVVVSIYGKHASYWPLYVAQAEGFFEDEGITVELLVPQAGSGITQSVMSGSVNIGIGTPDGFLTAKDQGQDVKTVASLQNLPIGGLMVGPGTTFPDDVKGQIVAVSNEKSGDAYLTIALLEAAGLTTADYSFLSAGGTPDRAAALSSGGVAAALIGQPQDFSLIRSGYERVGLADDVVADFAWQWMTVQSSWADRNEEALAGFLRATQRAVDWWYDPANEDAAVQLLATEGNVDESDAQATYELWFDKAVFQKDLVPSEAAFDGIIDFMVTMDLLDGVDDPTYEDFVDLSVLEGLGG